MRKHKTIPKATVEAALRAAFPQMTERAGGLVHQFSLNTAFGPLWVSPCDGAIRTCFEEVPPAAPAGTHLNPYSGKWNFEGLDDDSQLGRALYCIGRIAA